LPSIPDGNAADSVSLLLCYQYVEPPWTKKEHKGAITQITDLANKHGIKGRGRCAPEGLNCTLTGSAQGLRDFCNGLRAWNKTFEETDFKLTDGLPRSNGFKVVVGGEGLVAPGVDLLVVSDQAKSSQRFFLINYFMIFRTLPVLHPFSS
jgi:hypothetical protein